MPIWFRKDKAEEVNSDTSDQKEEAKKLMKTNKERMKTRSLYLNIPGRG